MVNQPPVQKSFFAKYWGLLLAGGLVIGLVLLAAIGTGAYFLLRSNVQANTIAISMDKPELGKPFSAKVELENKGVLSAKDYHAVLLVDGEEIDTEDLTLESKDPQTVTFDIKGLPAGKHTASIGGVEKEFTVYRPAELKLTGFTLSTDKLMVGEAVKVSATVKNVGELPGDFAGELTLDGGKLKTLEATVEAGQEQVLEAEFTMEERGSHSFALEGENRAVTVIAPAHVEVTGLKLSKAYPKPKEAITATVTMQNDGDLPGKYNLILNINGKAAQEKEVTVEANSTLSVAFKVSQEKAGGYTIKVGDFSQSMRVVVITRPANGALLVKKANSGYGRLTLKNGYKQDAIIILASTSNPKVPLLTVYVRAGSTTSKIKVKDGTYYIFYSVGSNYDSASKKFITEPSYGRFQESIKFTTTRSTYSLWNVSIGVSGGNAGSIGLGEDEFPK